MYLSTVLKYCPSLFSSTLYILLSLLSFFQTYSKVLPMGITLYICDFTLFTVIFRHLFSNSISKIFSGYPHVNNWCKYDFTLFTLISGNLYSKFLCLHDTQPEAHFGQYSAFFS